MNPIVAITNAVMNGEQM